MGTRQYLRKGSLRVGNDKTGLDLSDLRFQFATHQTTIQTPHYAEFRVYNLSLQTELTIRNEFVEVLLTAGYEGNEASVFGGAIKQIRQGRENATDTYLDILAADSDAAYNFAVMNQTLRAGWSQETLHAAVIDSFASYGVLTGAKPALSNSGMPRGRVCYGMTRDHATRLADTSGCAWSILDSRLDLIPYDRPLDGPPIVLTSRTGMIGLPLQTIEGIVVRALLNPALKRGATVQIDNASIQQAAMLGSDVKVPVRPAGLGRDGLYKIIAAGHTGDSRGQPWYTDIICRAVDPTTGFVAMPPDVNIENPSGR